MWNTEAKERTQDKLFLLTLSNPNILININIEGTALIYKILDLHYNPIL